MVTDTALVAETRFQQELAKTPDPVEFALTFPERMRWAMEQTKTPEEANFVRAMLGMGDTYLRQALPRVTQDRHERYLLMFPTESAYFDISAAAGVMWAADPDRSKNGGDRRSEKFQCGNFRTEKSAEDAGFKDSRDATTCERLGKLDPQDRELYKNECLQNERHLTISGGERVWHLMNPHPKPVIPPLPDGVFDVIAADPPWEYDFSRSDSRQIENHYPTLPLADMQEIDVPAAEDSVLFMWATSPKLREALELMEAWGFEYKTCMVWVKDKIGMGYYARQEHELVLIGTKGHMELPDPSVRPPSVFFAPRMEHSEKPDVLYELIDTMYPDGTKLEMFARKQREGWEVWGDEL